MSRATVPPWRTWLQLVRAPNLFTVPGDPVAGYVLANFGSADASLGLAVLASLCFYAAGLLLNDLADLEEDRRERPKRPLPSGAASPARVWMVAIGLSLAGVGALVATGKMAAVACGVALLASICAYNFYTKHLPVIGALNMGLCRTLSVFVGALTGPYGQNGGYPLAVPAALPLGAYIAAVTNLARHETRATVPVTARLLPAICVAVLGFWGAGLAFNAPAKIPAAVPFLVATGCAGWLALRMFRRPAPPLPPLIGMHIRLLLPLQAAIAWLADPWGAGGKCAVGLFCLWPVARVVSRWFYAS